MTGQALVVYALTISCCEQADGSGLELTTPPLDGTILPGVTRDSILALARAWNDIEVAERYLTIREIKQVMFLLTKCEQYTA